MLLGWVYMHNVYSQRNYNNKVITNTNNYIMTMAITMEMCMTMNYIIKDNITMMIYVKYSLIGIGNKQASKNCTINDTSDMNLNACKHIIIIMMASHIATVLQLMLAGL